VGINHLGHFLLSDLLLPKMNKESGRIVVTASGGKSRQTALVHGNLGWFIRK